MKINRQALIIHNAGDTKDKLNGVAIDIENIKRFLTSNYGGAWADDEIVVAPDGCSLEYLKIFFLRKSRFVNYYMIFFVGHGCYDMAKGPVYGLPNGWGISREWLKQQTYGKPTLLITDSCQCIERLKEGGKLRESKTFSWVSDSVERQKYRKAYDEILSGLPRSMFVTASSVSPGEEAGENDAIGGYYIHSLIDAAKGIIDSRESQLGVYGIGYIHFLASAKVRHLSQEKQTPLLEGYTRSHQPPFMVKY